jgi:nitroimidazol reductase NimA-like FMN-containing flavoprotein (pyridoxamine 5'-phosphate oxidase superfamily)
MARIKSDRDTSDLAAQVIVGRSRNQPATEEKVMAIKELSATEVDELLRGERAMCIGFDANDERYLVPLGFIWHQGALYAMTTQGRKTRMAAANPKVSFQIDTSARTGLFSWHSLSGEGTFEVVTDSKELDAISPVLVSRFPDMPGWMQTEYAVKQAQGKVVFVRIRPTRMTGRKSEPA